MKKWLSVMIGFLAVAWNTHASPTTVVAWGDNTYGQTNVPAGLTNVIAIAQGGMHGLALNGDSTVTAWGYNYTWTTPHTYEGQATTPVGLSNVVAIAAGYDSSVALKNDGSIVFWGDTGETNLPSGLSNVVAIAAGELFSVGLRNDRAIIAWGPQVTTPPTLTNVYTIVAGGFNTVAIQSNRTLSAWGHNFYGEDNVPASATNVVAVAAGLYHMLALRGNGTVVAWGYNGYGETNVPTSLSNVVQVAAGFFHSLALKSDGTVVAWGDNSYGQTTIPVGLKNVVAISGNRSQSLALVSDGSPWIAQQPTSQTTYSGMNATFTVSGIGTTNVNYQWCFYDTNILGATNVSLLLTNVQTTNSGNYSVVLSNAVGVVISSNAVFSVSNSPPIVSPSASQIVVALHSNALMTASTTGSFPQFYQWQFNGTNIARATNAFLSLTNAQLTNSGNYAVIVTNAYGSTTGLFASLTIMDLGAALNATNLVWTTSSTYPWFPETSTNHDGIAAAQSATPPFPQYSTLQTTVTGPGTLTFWAECSQFFDYYLFSASGSYEQSVFIPPFGQWAQETVYLGTGTQSLQWLFQKSPFGSTGLDAVWLDQVSFVAGATPATITSISSNQIVPPATNVTFTVYAVGTPPLSYQWNFNGNILLGATNFSLSLTNVQLTNAGVYSVTVTNIYGTPVVTNASLLVQMPQFDTSPANMFMSSQGFNFQLDGLTGHGAVVIFASTDLLTWLPIFTNPPTTGAMQVLDTNAVYLPFRFYRAAEQ
jgi:alpha-tubulin suppressor-like RCC1 family protein